MSLCIKLFVCLPDQQEAMGMAELTVLMVFVNCAYLIKLAQMVNQLSVSFFELDYSLHYLAYTSVHAFLCVCFILSRHC